MNTEKEGRSISYIEEAARDNSLFTTWTQTWGMSVRPWYEKDKLKFSFIEIGKEGKGNSFDIYMDTIKFGAPCFYKWANDILSPNRRFENIMSQEATSGEKYPKHYKFITGYNGDKSIGICNSNNGRYCINATTTLPSKKKVFANIPLDFNDLEILSILFVNSYKERINELNRIRIEAANKVSSFYNDVESEENVATTEESSSANISPQVPSKNAVPYTVSYPSKGKGEFLFAGIDEKGENVILHVENSVLVGAQAKEWTNLSEELKKGPKTVNFSIEERNGTLFILEIF